METIISGALGVWKTIQDMPTILLFAFALNVVGWALKRVDAVPNKWIPIILLSVSAVVVPFILPEAPGDMSHGLANPETADGIRQVSVGLVVGLLAWGAHKLVFQHLGKLFPGLNEEDADTQPRN